MTEEERDYTAWGDQIFNQLWVKIDKIDIEDTSTLKECLQGISRELSAQRQINRMLYGDIKSLERAAKIEDECELKARKHFKKKSFWDYLFKEND